MGKISGTMIPMNGAWYIMVSNAADTSGTYINQGNGTFLVNTLNPGIYNVHIYANPDYLDKDIFPVTVTAGQTMVLGTIIMDPMTLKK